MKISLVFERNGKTPKRRPDGNHEAFPVYRWYVFQRGDHGWELHLFAFCQATTEDFRFQAFQGVFALGRGKRGVWAELCINEHILHIGASNA